GNTLVIGYVQSTASGDALSCGDDAGNTWGNPSSRLDQSGGTTTLLCHTTQATSSVSTTQNITVTNDTSRAKRAMVVLEFSGVLNDGVGGQDGNGIASHGTGSSTT